MLHKNDLHNAAIDLRFEFQWPPHYVNFKIEQFRKKYDDAQMRKIVSTIVTMMGSEENLYLAEYIYGSEINPQFEYIISLFAEMLDKNAFGVKLINNLEKIVDAKITNKHVHISENAINEAVIAAFSNYFRTFIITGKVQSVEANMLYAAILLLQNKKVEALIIDKIMKTNEQFLDAYQKYGKFFMNSEYACALQNKYDVLYAKQIINKLSLNKPKKIRL